MKDKIVMTAVAANLELAFDLCRRTTYTQSEMICELVDGCPLSFRARTTKSQTGPQYSMLDSPPTVKAKGRDQLQKLYMTDILTIDRDQLPDQLPSLCGTHLLTCLGIPMINASMNFQNPRPQTAKMTVEICVGITLNRTTKAINQPPSTMAWERLA